MKILVFPKDKNPYQYLLYQNMKNDSITYLAEDIDENLLLALITIPFELIIKRLQGYEIFHLHWLNKFHTHTFDSFISRLFFFIYTIVFLIEIKILGFKLVWTIHNILPHEKQTIDDNLILRLLCNLTDQKIIHSEYTRTELNRYNVNTNGITIIPIGNYIQLYENTISKHDARNKLGIPDEAFVFSYFGLIRKYKGVDKLIESFLELYRQNKNIVLIISGKCDDKKFAIDIAKVQSKYKKCIYTFIEYIPDKNVQLFFNAADIMVFPFNQITTSSSTILASSFGKAFIYPQMGNLVDLPGNLGFSYNSSQTNGLKKTMMKAISQKKKLNELNHKNLAYAKTLSWDMISNRTLNVYRNLISKK